MSGRLLVVRFSPFSAEKCRLNAEDTYAEDLRKGRIGRYGVSVFGCSVLETDVEINTPEVDRAITELCRKAPVGGRTISRIWADDVARDGWALVPDRPPHYLVGVGDLTGLPDFERMALLWSDNRCRNPAWTKR